MGDERNGTPEPLRRHGVTGREATVLAEVVDRRRNPEIAERLVISVRTVESHLASLLRKLQAPDRAALVEIGAALLAPDTTLPRPATSFIGREHDREELAELLRHHRLVTVTGSGGVGKTRLAIRVAEELSRDPAHLITFADLSAAADGDVPEALADALGLRDRSRPGWSWEEALREHRGLLLIDNCEHVVSAAARHVAELLAAARGLRVLATSREPLRVPGEVVHVLGPMSLSDTSPGGTASGRTDAEELFTERARAASPGFGSAERDVAGVQELCRRLDGLPLAIELAAARTRSFSVDDLLAHLDQRFALLVDGARTAQPRQQTLQATLDWSYHLLDPVEQELFLRLSVFPGSFGYEAIEQVCAGGALDPATVLRTLPRLLDKSLVSALIGDPPVRYRLSESVRLYALQRSPPPGDDAHARHAAYFLGVATEAAPELRGPSQRAWLARLETERPNLRAALEWTVTSGSAGDALRFLCALAPFWEDSGRTLEAHGWVDRILARHDAADPATAVTAHIAASALLRSSDVARARAFAEQAVELASENGLNQLHALSSLGWAWAYEGRPDEAGPLLRRVLQHLHEGEEQARAIALQGLALVTTDLPEALELAREAGRLFRGTGDRIRQANTLYTMATRALDASVATDDIGDWLEESLALSAEAGSEHHRAHALLGLARLGWLRGQDEDATARLQRCVPTLRRLGDLRCTGRALLLSAELAGHRGDAARAQDLLRQSIRAARPAADHATLEAASQRLTGSAAYPPA